jgi:hypothetical protein
MGWAIAAVAKGSKVCRATFDPQKCCAMHEWPLRRAAPQHFEVLANGGKGPFVSFVTKS